MSAKTQSKPLGPEENIGSIFEVRRDLTRAIKEVALADSTLSLDQADLLLELFWAQKGHGGIKADSEGFVAFKDLEGSLLNSQPHVWRRIRSIKGDEEKGGEEKWVKVDEARAGHRHHANSHFVRITKQGISKIEPVWSNYQKLAATLFREIPAQSRQVHLQVNELIRKRLHYFADYSSAKRPTSGPPENIVSILKAARELVPTIKKTVTGSTLSLEDADLLVYLYGARELKWPELKADSNGFVTLKRLQASLVHSQSTNQVLFSRRIRKLKDEWVEIRRAKPGLKNLSENDSVRITESGVKPTALVWGRYTELGQKLLGDLPMRDRRIHFDVNEALLAQLQPAWTKLL